MLSQCEFCFYCNVFLHWIVSWISLPVYLDHLPLIITLIRLNIYCIKSHAFPILDNINVSYDTKMKYA